jgi:hypothetical protein
MAGSHMSTSAGCRTLSVHWGSPWSLRWASQRCAAAGAQAAEMTVVFDAGQNSADNFTRLAGSELHYVGSVPASDCPDLLALPAAARTIVDEQRYGGLTALDTRREAYGAQRRAILTHSPELHAAQAAGFTGTTLAAGPAGRDRRDRPALPGRPGPAPRPPHAHRDHHRPGQAHRDLRPRPLRPQGLRWVMHQPSLRISADQRKRTQDQLIQETQARSLARQASPRLPGRPDRRQLPLVV